MTPIKLEDIIGAIDIQTDYVELRLLAYPTLIQEMAEMSVTLLEDPLEGGITQLNGFIAQVDAQKTRAAAIVQKAIENESGLETLVKKMQGLFKTEFDKQLISSPAADFTNAGSRESACNSILCELKTLTNSIEGSYAQARTFSKIAGNNLAKLDSTNKNISRQITVLQLANEIGEISRPSSKQESSTYDFK